MEMGCHGIVVSNHGGRALDNAPASILVLLELNKHCPEIFDRLEVFIDGGVRRGSDVLKALCLGASGVGIGRPFMYALNYGRAGVQHLINGNSLHVPMTAFLMLTYLPNCSSGGRSCYGNAVEWIDQFGRGRPYYDQHR
jgi:L-lactate dehydrogenase (cytochrome)